MSKLTSILSALLIASSVNAASVAFDNFNPAYDGAQIIRDATGTAVTGAAFKGILGTFTISDSAIVTAFSQPTPDLAAISTGFSSFGTSFSLDDFGAGIFSTNQSGDTKVASNSIGGSTIYSVFFKGASIATATELLITKLTATFPTDPAVGAPLSGSAQLNSAGLAPSGLLVGSVGASYDAYGNGALPSYQMALVGAAPEPSRAMLAGLGLMGLVIRRRRK